MRCISIRQLHKIDDSSSQNDARLLLSLCYCGPSFLLFFDGLYHCFK